MRNKEYPSLLSNGFKDITEADLHYEFVEQLKSGHDHRNNLLIGFGSFLNEFKKLNLKAEIWIDGSFATEAPDPSDVDVVFYFKKEEVEGLPSNQKQIFERLFQSRKFMKGMYSVEVFYGEIGNNANYNYWQRVFGTCYDNITPKGIFRLKYQ
jgi:hypothetical protein